MHQVAGTGPDYASSLRARSHQKWVEKAPSAYQARLALGVSALQLGNFKNDDDLRRESITRHREAA